MHKLAIPNLPVMSDVHDKQTRSYNMSRIRGKDTKPEMLVRKFLFSKGFRYRLHVKKLAGTPDIVLSRLQSAIFINGCFWHGHDDCPYFVVPKTRTNFWLNKIQGNKNRDEENISELKRQGWKVFTIFECELRGEKQEITLRKLFTQLSKVATTI